MPMTDAEKQDDKPPKKTPCVKKLYEKILGLAAFKIRLLEKYLSPLALLAARLYVAHVFWISGQDKLAEGFDHAKDTFATLFQPEWEANHIKHIFGKAVSFPVPGEAFGAFGTTYVEIGLAVLLAIGFMGRAAAFGIFMMALAIELCVYPDTPENYYWMLLMALIMARGPGLLSIDYFMRKWLFKQVSSRLEAVDADRDTPLTVEA
ncbi:MAG: DoxX family membrane protein [Alphaproteobacteria bacterium]|nr:DoxX family membrane protein [Alphaproteobacteria bacterium]